MLYAEGLAQKSISQELLLRRMATGEFSPALKPVGKCVCVSPWFACAPMVNVFLSNFTIETQRGRAATKGV